MTPRVRRLPTAPEDLERVLSLSVEQAKRARRLATLDYVRGLTNDARERHGEAVKAVLLAMDAANKTQELYRTAMEIEDEARKALED